MAAPSTRSNKLTLQPNVPELIALRYPAGKVVESRFGDGQQVMYSLTDGRTAFFSLGVSQKINELQLGNREEFYICKKTTSKAPSGYIDVWLTPEGERTRELANQDEPQEQPTLLERQLAASVAEVQGRKAPASAPAPPPPQGTGTNGPVAVPSRVQQSGLLPWGQSLLHQTNQLVDVYAQACLHAEAQGVPPAVVRTVMLSAFIGLQKKGGA